MRSSFRPLRGGRRCSWLHANEWARMPASPGSVLRLWRSKSRVAKITHMSNIGRVTPAARVYRSTESRRQEIVDAAIRTLASHGYAATSFARIMDAAGLSSTRMISYHFADKAALMEAIVASVIREAAAAMVPAIEGA